MDNDREAGQVRDQMVAAMRNLTEVDRIAHEVATELCAENTPKTPEELAAFRIRLREKVQQRRAERIPDAIRCGCGYVGPNDCHRIGGDDRAEMPYCLRGDKAIVLRRPYVYVAEDGARSWLREGGALRPATQEEIAAWLRSQ